MYWRLLRSGSNVCISGKQFGSSEAYQSVHGVSQLRDGHSAALFNEPCHRLVLGRRDADELASVVNNTRQPAFRL